MIIYNVTISVDLEVHEMWLTWMKHTHVPQVMATGYFRSYRICRVLAEEDTGATYAIQYTCADMASYELYKALHAPRLQAESEKYYGGKALAFRTLLEVLESDVPSDAPTDAA